MIKAPEEIISAIKESHKIGLMTHLNGDGDAFGSLLGLRNILKNIGKEVVIFSNEDLPEYFDYIAKDIDYKNQDKYEKVDLLIGLDLVSPKRFTIPVIFEEARKNSVNVAIIDHHTEGEIHLIADYLWRVQKVSSTAELVYWLSLQLGLSLDKVTAQLILIGLETDTYFLTNKNVFDSTIEAQKGLCEFGGDTEIIKKGVLESSPTNNIALMKKIMDRVIIRDKIIFTYITLEDKKEAGLAGQNISSVIASHLDTLKKPKVSIAAEQRTDDVIKFSMRSNNSATDVAAVSKEFGGGGHVHAAGFEISGNIEKIIQADFINELFAKIS